MQAPIPVVQTVVSPSPVVSSVVSNAAQSTTYRVEATLTFRETAGGSGRITRILGVVVADPAGNSTGNLDVSLPISANGTATYSLFQEFTLSAASVVVWHLSATGTDSAGRTFNAQVAEINIQSPAQAPVPISSTTRIELWGGDNYVQFLGCVTCNEFDRESIFNRFGPYGSRFSSTSIWNRFGSFGSQFSTHSPCSQFASNPPVLIDVANGTLLGELTLNRFRANAIREPAVLTWLEHVACEE